MPAGPQNVQYKQTTCRQDSEHHTNKPYQLLMVMIVYIAITKHQKADCCKDDTYYAIVIVHMSKLKTRSIQKTTHISSVRRQGNNCSMKVAFVEITLHQIIKVSPSDEYEH